MRLRAGNASLHARGGSEVVTTRHTFFAKFRDDGYSFSLYREDVSIQDSEKRSAALATVIMPLLAAGVEIPYVRISDIEILGDSLLTKKAWKNAEPGMVNPASNVMVTKPAVDGEYPDMPWTAVKIKLIASTVAKGQINLRLVPDDVFVKPLGFVPDPSWDRAFDTFVDELCGKKDPATGIRPGNGWVLRGTAKTNVNPLRTIQGAAHQAPPGVEVSVITKEDHGFLVNDQVRLGRTGSSQLDGVWTVSFTDGSKTFRLLNSNAVTDVIFTGTARKIQTVSSLIKDCQHRGVTKRNSGRPFGLQVGRRRKKKK